MPTVSVGKDLLFEALGRSYTDEEFDELCFAFGIELDDVTTEKAIIKKEKHLDDDDMVDNDADDEVIYKIEVPANRYDLLCLEGLVQSLRIFLGVDEIPRYRVSSVPKQSMLKMEVKPRTAEIRPFVVCAVLRGITFDQARYNSFIDLQDKLHQNICRKRTLVAIGTHDLDTLTPPFTYDALPPSDINFVPLKQDKSFRADELMEYYKSDNKLKKFLHIIENSSVFPVIYDSKRTVLSLPPIINGAHSAISMNTKNVFIECTATDKTKAEIVLNMMVTMFSVYCKNKYEAEPVEVLYPSGERLVYPDLSDYPMDVSLSYITRNVVGVSLEAGEVISLLNKMQLRAENATVDKQGRIRVSVPPTRSDVLHAVDVAEDIAIAYGYNNIPKIKPVPMPGKRDPLNNFSDLVREQVAHMGFMEVLNWILCSSEENFSMLNRNDDGKTSVIVGNPRSSDFEAARTNLMAGMLKTLKHNVDYPRPIKIFEVGDVLLLDETKDVGARNSRRLAALYCSGNSGFEVIIGLVERIMDLVRKPGGNDSFHLRPSHEPEFFPNRQNDIMFNGKKIGCLGIVHPEVLKNFGIGDPCSYAEIELEPLQ